MINWLKIENKIQRVVTESIFDGIIILGFFLKCNRIGITNKHIIIYHQDFFIIILLKQVLSFKLSSLLLNHW